ncbi:MAG: phosphotransferase [Planctomycetota bacterium]
MKRLGNVENVVYELAVRPEPRIVRVTEPIHRSRSALEAELHWIAYLQNAGVAVAAPISAADGAAVVVVKEKRKTYFVSVFERAPGGPFRGQRQWRPELARSISALLAQMHRATKKYRVPAKGPRRHHWLANDHLARGRHYIPRGDKEALREYDQFMAWGRSLKESPGTFGLVHTDLHWGNFFVDRGMKLTAFDFDDSAYHFFAYDLCIAQTSYRNWRQRLGDRGRFKYDDFCDQFREEYEQHYRLAEIWWRRIAMFERFRAMEMFAWCHKMFDLRYAKKWQLQLLQRCRANFGKKIDLR